MNEELQEGSIILMVKNKDASFSPLMMNKDHAYILKHFISGFSEDKPLAKLKDKYIKL